MRLNHHPQVPPPRPPLLYVRDLEICADRQTGAYLETSGSLCFFVDKCADGDTFRRRVNGYNQVPPHLRR